MSNRIYALFVRNVRDRMDDLGLRQTALAKALGVTDSYVSQILNGQRRPGLDSLESFADALAVEPSELIKSSASTREKKIAKSA